MLELTRLIINISISRLQSIEMECERLIMLQMFMCAFKDYLIIALL